MSTGRTSARVKIVKNGISTNPPRPEVSASKEELRAAIDKLWMEVHLSKHPVEKVRLYEEMKMLENGFSSLRDGD